MIVVFLFYPIQLYGNLPLALRYPWHSEPCNFSFLVLNLRTREVIFDGQFSILWDEIIVWNHQDTELGLGVSFFLFSGLNFTSDFLFGFPLVNLTPLTINPMFFLVLLSCLWGFCSYKGNLVYLGVNFETFNH
jgi:hypothetical protein